MNRKTTFFALVAAALLASSCKSHYEVTGVERTRILIDSRWDAQPDQQAQQYLVPFKHDVDSVLGPVVGNVARNMTPHRPESELSNLLPDILMWAAKDYNEQPVFAVYNMGGIRNDLIRGEVTYGDVLNIAPFENKIAFLTLSGADVLELFGQIAMRGGEGVSKAVHMEISKDGRLLKATLNGETIDPQKDYRVATIDYLLGGNDQMTAFTKGRNINSPQEFKNNTRFIIMDYFRAMQAQGKVVDAEIEGRIVVDE
ncbi:MAG: 5'-nucleotidase C-terminal domain-containing protein [Prevotella sp.]|nr:5'-nucleotidase C-terminal domain-containing protein [Prevotella sp.]